MSGPCIDDWKVSDKSLTSIWTEILPNCFTSELSKLSFFPTHIPTSDLIPIDWWVIHRLKNGLITHLQFKKKNLSVTIFNDALMNWNIIFKEPDLEVEEVFINDLTMKAGEVPEEMIYKGIWIPKEAWRKSSLFYIATVGVKQYFIYVDE